MTIFVYICCMPGTSVKKLNVGLTLVKSFISSFEAATEFSASLACIKLGSKLKEKLYFSA